MFKIKIKSLKKKVAQKKYDDEVDDNDESEDAGYQFGGKQYKNYPKKIY